VSLSGLSVTGVAHLSRMLRKEYYDHEKLFLRNLIARPKGRGFKPILHGPRRSSKIGLSQRC
jgi:hypothetical protein